MSVILRLSFSSASVTGSLAGAVVTFDFKGLPQWFDFFLVEKMEAFSIRFNEIRGQGVNPTLCEFLMNPMPEGIPSKGRYATGMKNHFLEVRSSLGDMRMSKNKRGRCVTSGAGCGSDSNVSF